MRSKPDEPQDRQWDATSPRAVGGANRRGGERPRGRNVWVAGNDLPKARRRATCEAPGVDTGGDVDGGAVLWKTLKEALGGTEPSGCEMRLRTRNAPDGRADVGPGQPGLRRHDGRQAGENLGEPLRGGEPTGPGEGPRARNLSTEVDVGSSEHQSPTPPTYGAHIRGKARRNRKATCVQLIAPTRDPPRGNPDQAFR